MTVTLWIEVPRGVLAQATVRDPSVMYKIGRVAGGDSDENGLRLRIELDEDALRSRLRERRGAF